MNPSQGQGSSASSSGTQLKAWRESAPSASLQMNPPNKKTKMCGIKTHALEREQKMESQPGALPNPPAWASQWDGLSTQLAGHTTGVQLDKYGPTPPPPPNHRYGQDGKERMYFTDSTCLPATMCTTARPGLRKPLALCALLCVRASVQARAHVLQKSYVPACPCFSQFLRGHVLHGSGMSM